MCVQVIVEGQKGDGKSDGNQALKSCPGCGGKFDLTGICMTCGKGPEEYDRIPLEVKSGKARIPAHKAREQALS